MDRELTKKEIQRLLREHSVESSVSLSANRAEVSFDPFRRSINTQGSQINMAALMKTFQMEAKKSLEFTDIYVCTEEKAIAYIEELILRYQSEKEKINDYWYFILAIKPPNKFIPSTLNLISLIHSILQDKIIDIIPSLLLLNYLIIAPFWSDFGSLAIDKSTTVVSQIKDMIKHFTKNRKLNAQNKPLLTNKIYLQTIDSIGNELYTFLLPLFQIVKKKPSFFYCFITISELIEKLNKKNLMTSLNANTLNQLELNLSKKQKVVFDEVFVKQPDPIFDKNLAMKSEMLQPYKEELFNAFMNFEYRNNISFNQLLYTFESLFSICRTVESIHPKAFEKCLGFKVLIKTMAEIFEYFCSKLSNLNTECLMMLDSKLEPIEYFIKFVSNKKKQELFNAYIKVNKFFDKEPNQQVSEVLENKVVKVEFEPKLKPKKNIEYSNNILAQLRLCKKIPEIPIRIENLIKVLEMIKNRQDSDINNKVKHDLAKIMLKLLKYAADETSFSNQAKAALDRLLINFLEIPEALYSKNFLEKLKQKYEIFNQAHTFIPEKEIFTLIRQNLEKMISEDEYKRSIDGTVILSKNISGVSIDSRSSKMMDSPLLSKSGSYFYFGEMDSLKIYFEEYIDALIIDPNTIDNLADRFEKHLDDKAKTFPEVVKLMNDIDQTIVRNEYFKLLKNIACNYCLKYLNKPSDVFTQRMKPIIQKFVNIFDQNLKTMKTSIFICIDDFDRIICHNFLTYLIDEKSGIFQFDAQLIKVPGKSEPIYDVSYFFGLIELDYEQSYVQTLVGQFVETLSINKNRKSTLEHIKEQSLKNNTFRMYSYQEELARGTLLNFIVSYKKQQWIKFVIMPISYRIVSLP